MSTFRYVFLLIYFLFHALLLLGSIRTITKIKESDFKFINGFINDENLLLNSSNLITFTIIGLVLFGINAIMLWYDRSREKRRLSQKDAEINSLKAKLFDLQGTPPEVPSKTTTESGEDENPPIS
jgi:predicted membrane protein